MDAGFAGAKRPAWGQAPAVWGQTGEYRHRGLRRRCRSGRGVARATISCTVPCTAGRATPTNFLGETGTRSSKINSLLPDKLLSERCRLDHAIARVLSWVSVSILVRNLSQHLSVKHFVKLKNATPKYLKSRNSIRRNRSTSKHDTVTTLHPEPTALAIADRGTEVTLSNS